MALRRSGSSTRKFLLPWASPSWCATAKSPGSPRGFQGFLRPVPSKGEAQGIKT